MPSRSRRSGGNQSRRLPAVAKRRAPEPLVARVNQELYKRNAELAVRNKTLALLRKLDEISMTALGVGDMAREIATVIGAELGYDIVSVATTGSPAGPEGLQWVAMASPVPRVAQSLKTAPPRMLAVEKISRAAIVQALRRSKPVVTGSAAAVYPAPLAQRLTAAAKRGQPLASFLVHPLRVGREALGVLALGASRDLHDLTRYERESLQGIVSLVSLALFKAKIYEDLQRTSAELQTANVRLEQLDKAKSEFLSIASHQLYTPLTALRGYLAMLQEGDFGAVAGKQGEVVKILKLSSDRLVNLIRNLLDVSRIESGRLELSMESVDLVHMARELVTELQPNAAHKQLQLTFRDPPGKVPRVVADPQRLRQVLLNTLDNAIKYSEKGRVEVRVTHADGKVLYTVQDTGKGIAPQDLKRLFAKFTRVGGSDRYHTEGTGLGLYVARQIVREHQGDVWAESPGEGKGSTFFVKLPAEGSPGARKAGTKLTVGIKAAEAGEQAR